MQLTDSAFVSRLLVMKPRLLDIPFLPLKGSVLQQIYGFQHVRGELGRLPSKSVNKALSLRLGEGGWLLESNTRRSLPPPLRTQKCCVQNTPIPCSKGLAIY